jgi:hypothetical protein
MNSQTLEGTDGRNKPARKGAGWGNKSQTDESSGGVGWGAGKQYPSATDIANDPYAQSLVSVQGSHRASTAPR